VAEVVNNTAVGSPGLQAGDVIISVAGRRVRSARDFLNAEGQVPIGDSLEVEFLRDARVQSTTMMVQEPLEISGENLDARFAGAIFTELPARLRNGQVSGVLVAELKTRSRLAYEGLRPGDIITGANRHTIRNLSDLKAALTDAHGDLVLQISRNGEAYFARID